MIKLNQKDLAKSLLPEKFTIYLNMPIIIIKAVNL